MINELLVFYKSGSPNYFIYALEFRIEAVKILAFKCSWVFVIESLIFFQENYTYISLNLYC